MGIGFIWEKGIYRRGGIFGGVIYNREKQEWWIEYSSNPDKNIRLKDVKGVTQKEKIYRPE